MVLGKWEEEEKEEEVAVVVALVVVVTRVVWKTDCVPNRLLSFAGLLVSCYRKRSSPADWRAAILPTLLSLSQ